MAAPKDKLLAAIREFDQAVEGDRRYSRLREQLGELTSELNRMPDPREASESPGERTARRAGASNDRAKGAPPFFGRRATAQEGTTT